MMGESKLVRKKVGDAAARSCDPVFNAKFTFAVSSSKLSELVLQVSVYHANKFGRDVFLGVVHVPLEDLAAQNVEDWFPFKQRKAADKVSGELHMRVTNSQHGVVAIAESPTVEVYSAKVSRLFFLCVCFFCF